MHRVPREANLKYVMVLFLLLVLTGNSCALPVNTVTVVTTRDVESVTTVNEYIGKPFADQIYNPQYHGQIDRYSEEALRNDPTVLIATAKPINSNAILKLDMIIKGLEYDPKEKTLSEAKIPAEVVSSQMGNCLEVAILAKVYLQSHGYEARLFSLKTANSNGWHTICAFREIDGTWSLFQAAGGRYMGYTKGHAENIQQLINVAFANVVDYKEFP